MSHGLETRVPFLDNDLVDFAMSCPVSMKLNNLDSVVDVDENATGNKGRMYFQKTKDGKQILRDVMRNYIPERHRGCGQAGLLRSGWKLVQG